MDSHELMLRNLDQFSPQPCYVWASGTLWYAQIGGIDPSEMFTSTDRPDVLEQVGYDPDKHVLFCNQHPVLDVEII